MIKILPILHTERAVLRPMEANDAPTVVMWRNDPGNLIYMEKKEKISVQHHLKWFNSRPSTRLDYIVLAKSDGSLIGTVNLTLLDTNRSVSGRLFGNSSFKRKGYALEATKKWFDFAFNELDLNVIEAKTKVNNIPNINFNFKLGYTIKKIAYESSEAYFYMELRKENFKR